MWPQIDSLKAIQAAREADFETLSDFVDFEDVDNALSHIAGIDLRLKLMAMLRNENAFHSSLFLVGGHAEQTINLLLDELVALFGDQERGEEIVFQLLDSILKTRFGIDIDEFVKKKPEWIWPVVHQKSSGGGSGTIIFDHLFSALKMFDYTVGKTKGWPASKRQAFLKDFIELDLPPEVEEEFGDEYGKPLTTDRLRKVAMVISANCSNAYRRDEFSMRFAIADWESDLEFLRTQYYEGMGLKFVPWPDPRNHRS